MPAACATRDPVSTSVETSFREGVCLRFLSESQNSDGGWSSYPGSRSATEPTCLAVIAFSTAGNQPAAAEFALRGADWLRQAQLSDGSWPAVTEHKKGCWVTALACVALHLQRDESGAIAAGLAWLCNNWPAEGNLWWRIRARLNRKSVVVQQDSSLRGWSWTPGTASWVEPTAHALLALRTIPANLHPKGAAERIELGERMLYNRMCSGGGWNAGNPQVYGVGGMPRIGATAWALLALREYKVRWENQRSLDWLRRQYGGIRGPISLALAGICLDVYGCAPPHLEHSLQQLYSANQFLHGNHAAACAAIALNGPNQWLWGPRWKGTAHGSYD
jgi:hypothetical protein